MSDEETTTAAVDDPAERAPSDAEIVNQNAQKLVESLNGEVHDLTARNAALVAALKEAGGEVHELCPPDGHSDACVNLTDALAAEERAAKEWR